MKIGTVYWITGLAGSGKTTLGKRLYEQLRLTNNAVVFLDGDNLREVFGHEQGHTLADRKQLAMKYSRLCRMLSEQGIDVVCATISLFKEIHEFNRQHLQKYYEIFVECAMEELRKRDQKGIYSKALSGELQHVVGVDLPYDKPINCNLVIDNSTPNRLEEKVSGILLAFRE